MKWFDKNINYSRGRHESLIFKFDNSKYWLGFNACMTTQSCKSAIRALGKYYKAKSVEVKSEYADDSKPTESNVIIVVELFYSEHCYLFRTEEPVEEGELRKFRYFKEEEIFTLNE